RARLDADRARGGAARIARLAAPELAHRERAHHPLVSGEVVALPARAARRGADARPQAPRPPPPGGGAPRGSSRPSWRGYGRGSGRGAPPGNGGPRTRRSAAGLGRGGRWGARRGRTRGAPPARAPWDEPKKSGRRDAIQGAWPRA